MHHFFDGSQHFLYCNFTVGSRRLQGNRQAADPSLPLRDAQMPNVHHSAADGYSVTAATYVKGRPDYPPEVDTWLRGPLALTKGNTAVDLGAGTGKFLPNLRQTQANVIAVEPVAAMLAELVERNPGIEAKQGSAEHIPLADASVDAVVCAQSFHWFANANALNEIRRILKMGGVLGLIWNIRDESVPWVAALRAIFDVHEGDAPRYYTQAWKRVFPAPGFAPLCEMRFSHGHTGPAEHVIVDRVLSTSFIAALPVTQRNRVAVQVRQLIASAPDLIGKSEVTMPYVTAAYSCQKIG
jgi:SAM-dependent methyltransferase